MGISAVILCAGYGTRLQHDLANDETNFHLKGIPKPLLPLQSKPLIAYWIESFKNVAFISEIIIVTNEVHKDLYQNFLKDFEHMKKPVSIVSDGSTTNENRSGAVACMNLGVTNSSGDAFFIAGDTLFDKSFNLEEMIKKFLKLKAENSLVSLIVSAPVREEDVSKHGIIEVEENGMVKTFLEKPQPNETISRVQSPCCYLISQPSLVYINEFLDQMKNEPVSKKDATGNFIKYLVTKVPTFTFQVSKRYDIGSLSSYLDCCQNFSV
ncbi:UNVERIFIED_CONTAM: hypothetical protein RMT77_013086 [Armadillidium vulgare]